jgi:CPA1 family monovalent cation:H+ antiporter
MVNPEAADIGGAVIIAVILAGICRNRGWSSAIPLILAGIAVGLAPFGPQGPADPEFVLVVILAPLVFGEALTSSIVDLRRVRRPVLVLAVGLVVVGALAVGAVAQWVVPGIWTSMAFALGAILGPTDAVAVSATARKAGLPRRLVNILEGESLVNDGTALTLLRVFSLSAAAGSVTAAQGTLILVTSVLGGLLVGAAGGLALISVVRRARDTTVANGLILVAPLPLYVGAEALEGSGILAVVLAALIVAHGSSNAVAYTGRLQATGLWMTITFILQSAAFFLVGLEMPRVLDALPSDQIATLTVAIPVVFVTLVMIRFAFVFLMALVSGQLSENRGWLVAAWAGTRGPISALAAFTVPVATDAGDRIPYRELVISITFGVVIISLLLAPSIAWLARAVHLPKDDDVATERRVHLALARAALNRLEEIEQESERRDAPLPASVLGPLRARAQQRLERASASSKHAAAARHPTGARELAAEMMRSEQEELLRLRDSEGLPDEIVRQMQHEIDVRIRALGT